MRGLSEEFIKAFLKPNGSLHPILERLKVDDTLMLSIRENYVNIYYRGGNILRLNAKGQGAYTAFFDIKGYNIHQFPLPVLPDTIKNQEDSSRWVEAFQILKGVMDIYFSHHKKPEREFQQLLVRENNFSNVSNQSEYFIVDIEIADKNLGARIDALAVCWPVSKRKVPFNIRPAFIEMKYGDISLSGKSGIIKHLKDISNLIADKGKYEKLIRTMEVQLNQLNKLGLIKFKKASRFKEILVDNREKPEVIFVFANHNPRSQKLISILKSPECESFGKSEKFDLRFFVSSFAGYALHEASMLPLSKFCKLLETVGNREG